MKAKFLYPIFILLCLFLAACTIAQTIPEAGTAVEGDSPINAGQTPEATGTGERIATATGALTTSTATTEPASAETPETEIEHPTDKPLTLLLYRNETYGFRLALPQTWTGYQATTNPQDDGSSVCFSFPNHSPACVLQVDIYSKTDWDNLTLEPPNYYLDENEQYVFAAGPYQPECVQLDDFQCERYQEISSILAGFTAESIWSGPDILYRNETYGFHLTLPGTWAGYQATQNGNNYLAAVCFSFPEHGHLCVLQIDVFTKAAWNELATKPPNYYLDENEQYVFAAEPDYPTECVQMDAFQCERYQEISSILAGFVAESSGPGQPAPILYRNETYGFQLTLPGTWTGYQTIQDEHGDVTHICFTFPNYSPVCVLQIDVYTRAAWDRMVTVPPDYYRGENEQYVFGAGPNDGQCVQLDDFQCARHHEIPGILAGLVAESIGPGQPATILYRNETYGFRLTLPGTWSGYQVTQNGGGDQSAICFSFPEHGPICILQIDIFTKAAWNELTMKPSNYYLNENEQHVFAAGPYQVECVQLDAFQCDRYREIPGILAGLQVEKGCHLHWFFEEPAPEGVCPRNGVPTWAAAQYFERGAMIWLQTPGRYYVLEDAFMTSELEKRVLTIVSDPLDIWQDSSDQYQPPPGYHAPESGFGFVWRGDVVGVPNFSDRLGWALEPEFGYNAVLQCDDVPPSGGMIWQTCYLKVPDGRIVVLPSLGGWYWLDEQ